MSAPDAVEVLVQTVAERASTLAVGLFLVGLGIIVWQCVTAWLQQREIRRFSVEVKDRELVALLDTPGWPRLLEDARSAFRRMQNRPGAAFDLEAVHRGISAEVGGQGAWVRPIASTLVILALLATFQGMRGATADLTESMKKVDLGTSAARPAGAPDQDLADFRDKVTSALTQMTAAFGANLKGIFFAATLALLLPLLRMRQRLLLAEVRRFLELVVRPAISGEQVWVSDLVKALSRHGDDSTRRLEEQLRGHNDRLVEALSSMTRRTEDLVQALAPALSSALGQAREQLHQEQALRLDQYSEGFKAVAAQYERIIAVFSAHGARIEATIREVRRLNESLEARLLALDATAAAAQRNQEAAQAVLVQAQGSLSQVGDRFALGLMERTTEWKDSTSTLLREQRQAVESLAQAQSQMAAISGRFAEAVESVGRGQGAQADAVQKALDELKAQHWSTLSALQSRDAQLAEAVAQIQKLADTTAGALTSFTSASGQARGEISEGQRRLEKASADFGALLRSQTEEWRAQAVALQERHLEAIRLLAQSLPAASAAQVAQSLASLPPVEHTPDRFRPLHNEVVARNQQLGRSSESYDEFSRRLSETERNLKARGWANVAFEILMEEGVPVVRAVPRK